MSSAVASLTAPSTSVRPRTMFFLGMDVHKDSLTIAVLPDGAKTPERLDRLPNDLAKLKRFLDRLAERGELRCCYEASGAGEAADEPRGARPDTSSTVRSATGATPAT